MLYDNHMHCRFSEDSDADPIEMVMSAKSKGLAGITFTDHMAISYPNGTFIISDVANYLHTLDQISKEYSDHGFEILKGIELGLQTHVVSDNKNLIDSHDFDVVIGSIHLIDGLDPYYESFWEGIDPALRFRRFYETTLENIKAFTDFDTLGHLDYIFRYHHTDNAPDTYSDYRELVDAILQEIIKKDIALEVNCSPINKGMLYPNPMPDIIKRYHQLGGRLITLGADAHEPQNICAGFDILPDLLKDCGFNSYAVFKHRKPQEIAI